ncbi:MAG: 4-hydroxy-3-methylbut-2-enyl diphosphate reductase, partial [Planctomycetota bacterium]
RLRELGNRKGLPSYLIDDERDLDPSWFRPGLRIGLSAGASAPESLVQKVVSRLRELGAGEVRELAGETEAVTFKLPPELDSD